MMDRAQERLTDLDQRGYLVLEALRHAGGRSANTHSRPNQFLAIDGKTYWVKGNVQQGLVSELIAGRLARRSRAGPTAAIVHVSDEVAGTDIPSNQRGLVVGSLDVPGTVNARDLEALAPDLQLNRGGIDGASRARVIVFQTWIGVSDAQVLVRLNDGTVMSIDHGDAFGDIESRATPTPIVTPIPGTADDVGHRAGDVMVAVSEIQAIDDAALIADVSQVPAGAAWASPAPRRLAIAEYLAYRRDELEEVMRRWLRS